MHVFLYRQLRLGVLPANLDAEDIAEQVRDVVVVRLRDVALVKLRLLLRKTKQGLVKNALQGSTSITVPHTVISHHHHLVGIARRDRGEQTCTSATTPVLGGAVTGGKSTSDEEKYCNQSKFHRVYHVGCTIYRVWFDDKSPHAAQMSCPLEARMVVGTP